MMAKTIQLVNNLYFKAMNKPEELVCYKRQGREIYHAMYKDGCFCLSHYFTTILIVDVEKKVIVKLGGWSCSDRDAINSILELLDFPERVSVAGDYMHLAN